VLLLEKQQNLKSLKGLLLLEKQQNLKYFKGLLLLEKQQNLITFSMFNDQTQFSMVIP
jgi:hypothetical protein